MKQNDRVTTLTWEQQVERQRLRYITHTWSRSVQTEIRPGWTSQGQSSSCSVRPSVLMWRDLLSDSLKIKVMERNLISDQQQTDNKDAVDSECSLSLLAGWLLPQVKRVSHS